jgi:hypothetical protein
MTGTAFCSARALSGNVAAEPPRRVMKSRRLFHSRRRACFAPRQKPAALDFRKGSKADVTLLDFDVRFTPESGHQSAVVKCPLWATSEHDRFNRESGHELEDCSANP